LRPADLGPEDRRTFNTWMRAVALFYGLAALLLIGFVAARNLLSEPKTAISPARMHGSAYRPTGGGEMIGTLSKHSKPSHYRSTIRFARTDWIDVGMMFEYQSGRQFNDHHY